jgi:broad specificity phosphatase PhoE
VPADQIIVIRHAQKPTHKPKRIGIREDGSADPDSLTVRGWQHAGALAAVFAGPGSGAADALVARPDVIFAAGAEKKKVCIGDKELAVGSHSRRPLQTVSPLAEALKLTPVTTHTSRRRCLELSPVLSWAARHIMKQGWRPSTARPNASSEASWLRHR